MTSITTERLTLREATEADAAFMLALLNDPGFLANIGDRGVHTIAAAADYVAARLARSYAEHGFGMYVVERGDEAIGLTGFVRRGLPAPDLGFAFLAAHVGRGYGREAGAAMLDHGVRRLRLDPILAIAKPDNRASIALLERLGFAGDERVRLPATEGESRLLRYRGLGGGGAPGSGGIVSSVR